MMSHDGCLELGESDVIDEGRVFLFSFIEWQHGLKLITVCCQVDWVWIIKGERLVENVRCGAAMVTKIVKNTHSIYWGVKLIVTI